MEGSYSKVWNAREEAPAEEYKFFVDSLMGTIRYVVVCCLLGMCAHRVRRNEIASCEEAAYNSLPIKDAATLLFFRTQQEVLVYAQQVRGLPVSMTVSELIARCSGGGKSISLAV